MKGNNPISWYQLIISGRAKYLIILAGFPIRDIMDSWQCI